MARIAYSFGTGRGIRHTWCDAADVDTDRDGRPDAVALDFDGDGRVDDAMWDSDGDRVADTALLDLNDDGRPDHGYTDPSGAGVWNATGILPGTGPVPPSDRQIHWADTGGTGRTDRATEDVDGDGRNDAAWVDFDGDGDSDELVVAAGDDGALDQVLVDADGDGRMETAYLDADPTAGSTPCWWTSTATARSTTLCPLVTRTSSTRSQSRPVASHGGRRRTSISYPTRPTRYVAEAVSMSGTDRPSVGTMVAAATFATT